MSWLSGAINAFASGMGGAVVSSSVQKSNVKKSESPKEVKEAAIKSDRCASKVINPKGLPDQKTRDDVLKETLNGNYGSAWERWCEGTKSDRDPVTGESRNEPTSGSDINSTDKS